MDDLLLRLRQASIDQDPVALAGLYAESAVHEFPFTTPDGPSRIEGRAAIAEFLGMVYAHLPLRYTGYRTIAVHHVGDSTLIVEQEAVGVHTTSGAEFVLPNIAVIEIGSDGLITHYRDYANPAAVAGAIGGAP